MDILGSKDTVSSDILLVFFLFFIPFFILIVQLKTLTLLRSSPEYAYHLAKYYEKEGEEWEIRKKTWMLRAHLKAIERIGDRQTSGRFRGLLAHAIDGVNNISPQPVDYDNVKETVELNIILQGQKIKNIIEPFNDYFTSYMTRFPSKNFQTNDLVRFIIDYYSKAKTLPLHQNKKR